MVKNAPKTSLAQASHRASRKTTGVYAPSQKPKYGENGHAMHRKKLIKAQICAGEVDPFVFLVEHAGHVCQGHRDDPDYLPENARMRYENIRFEEGQIISLHFGGRIEGKPLPAGVYIAEKERNVPVLRMLGPRATHRAKALFRRAGQMAHAYVHTLPATPEVISFLDGEI